MMTIWSLSVPAQNNFIDIYVMKKLEVGWNVYYVLGTNTEAFQGSERDAHIQLTT